MPNDDPNLGEQLGKEVDRLDDLLNDGRGRWRRKNRNRTPGGCGSSMLATLLVLVGSIVAARSVHDAGRWTTEPW